MENPTAEPRKTFPIRDRRALLKVKLKSLSQEAKIIRIEESRANRCPALREELHEHRIRVVRRHTRNTHIAYGLIRGLTLSQIEPNRRKENEPDWPAIVKMIAKYGAEGVVPEDLIQRV